MSQLDTAQDFVKGRGFCNNSARLWSCPTTRQGGNSPKRPIIDGQKHTRDGKLFNISAANEISASRIYGKPYDFALFDALVPSLMQNRFNLRLSKSNPERTSNSRLENYRRYTEAHDQGQTTEHKLENKMKDEPVVVARTSLPLQRYLPLPPSPPSPELTERFIILTILT